MKSLIKKVRENKKGFHTGRAAGGCCDRGHPGCNFDSGIYGTAEQGQKSYESGKYESG